MAIVVYKCDTCKRNLEILRNIEGLETIQRCTITLGCRGKLYQTKIHPDFTRASIPDDVLGLDNWLQRKVLHNHNQTIESTAWFIVHQLGTYPSISVFVDRPTSNDESNREEILPTTVKILDSDTLVLEFDRPYSGIAQLVARASDPQLLQPSNATTSTVRPPAQISANGRITFATRIDKFGELPTLNLNLRYKSVSGVELTISYTAGDNPVPDTPWNGANRVLIKGKVYLVRQFDAITTEITAGKIINGTNFRFLSFDFNNDLTSDYVADIVDVTASPSPTVLKPNDIIVLLASVPFGAVDKILNAYVDVTTVTSNKNPSSLFYNGSEFFCLSTIIQPIYPLIRVI